MTLKIIIMIFRKKKRKEKPKPPPPPVKCDLVWRRLWMVHPLLERMTRDHAQTKRWLILEGVALGPTNREASLRPLVIPSFFLLLLFFFFYLFIFLIGLLGFNCFFLQPFVLFI
jgi:hypothetical protein